ncbi:MAG: hypothetical protein V1809_05960 [Planctomycetota bacterium]
MKSSGVPTSNAAGASPAFEIRRIGLWWMVSIGFLAALAAAWLLLYNAAGGPRGAALVLAGEALFLLLSIPLLPALPAVTALAGYAFLSLPIKMILLVLSAQSAGRLAAMQVFVFAAAGVLWRMSRGGGDAGKRRWTAIVAGVCGIPPLLAYYAAELLRLPAEWIALLSPPGMIGSDVSARIYLIAAGLILAAGFLREAWTGRKAPS